MGVSRAPRDAGRALVGAVRPLRAEALSVRAGRVDAPSGRVGHARVSAKDGCGVGDLMLQGPSRASVLRSGPKPLWARPMLGGSLS